MEDAGASATRRAAEPTANPSKSRAPGTGPVEDTGDRPPTPAPFLYETLVRRALEEDLGPGGDLTTDALVSHVSRADGCIVARTRGRIAGLGPAGAVFRLLDPDVEFVAAVAEGDQVEWGATVARVSGSARALLAAERTSLNFLGHLSGIATTTAGMVERIKHTRARMVCTRKTTPGLRTLEKYAVRMGGGANHRFGLSDGVLIKDNHLAVTGSVGAAVRRARGRVGHMVRVEVEVEDLDGLKEAIDAGADAALLDNMPVEMLRRAVELAAGRIILEASGSITPASVTSVAETGVDLLSVGWITHSSPALDVAFELEARAADRPG